VEGQLQIHVYLCNARCAELRCIHSATCPFEGDLWRQWRLFVNGAGARAAGGESKCGRPWGRATAGEPISAPDPQCLMTLTISQQDHRTVRQSHMHTVNNLEPMRAGNKRAKRRSTIAASTSCAFHQLRASRLAESAQMQPPIINAGRGDRLLLDAQAFDLFSIFDGSVMLNFQMHLSCRTSLSFRRPQYSATKAGWVLWRQCACCWRRRQLPRYSIVLPF